MTERTLTRERIEHYRYVMHNNLPKNWMSNAQHNDEAQEIDALCDMALRSLQPLGTQGRVKGPWIASRDGTALESEDFTHDVWLKISGDFETDEQRKEYADELCKILNYPAPLPDEKGPTNAAGPVERQLGADGTSPSPAAPSAVEEENIKRLSALMRRVDSVMCSYNDAPVGCYVNKSDRLLIADTLDKALDLAKRLTLAEEGIRTSTEWAGKERDLRKAAEAALREAQEFASECVSDRKDPSVNVEWMRCSPALPEFVMGLERDHEAAQTFIRHCAYMCGIDLPEEGTVKLHEIVETLNDGIKKFLTMEAALQRKDALLREVVRQGWYQMLDTDLAERIQKELGHG